MKKFLFVFLCSNLVYWIPALYRGYVSITSSVLIEGLVYFLLTWWLLWKFKDDGESIVRILFPLFLGLLWLELPYRIVGINDVESFFTLFHLLTTPIAIILAVYWIKHHNYKVLSIGSLCWLLLAIVGNTYWMEFAHYGTLSAHNLAGYTIKEVGEKEISIDDCREKYIVIYLHTGPLFDMEKNQEFIELAKNPQVRFVETEEEMTAISPRAKRTPTIIILNEQRDMVFKGSIRFATSKLKVLLF